jgi:threonine/homoserine/homoserine lactone efflux protein
MRPFDLPSPTSQPLLTSVFTGLLMGQVVMGLSAQHQGSLVGLGFALVFLLSGSASLVLWLLERHRRERVQRAPTVHRWLLMLSAGLMASICLDLLLIG